MQENLNLTHPWLVAVWPGMGHVGINAGVYLLSKLSMTEVAELDTGRFQYAADLAPRVAELFGEIGRHLAVSTGSDLS